MAAQPMLIPMTADWDSCPAVDGLEAPLPTMSEIPPNGDTDEVGLGDVETVRLMTEDQYAETDGDVERDVEGVGGRVGRDILRSTLLKASAM